MSKLINEEDVIELIRECYYSFSLLESMGDIEGVISDIESLPAIELKKGKWIKDNLVGWKCSNCGEHIVLDIKYGNYCPNCGADMRGERDEIN